MKCGPRSCPVAFVPLEQSDIFVCVKIIGICFGDFIKIGERFFVFFLFIVEFAPIHVREKVRGIEGYSLCPRRFRFFEFAAVTEVCAPIEVKIVIGIVGFDRFFYICGCAKIIFIVGCDFSQIREGERVRSVLCKNRFERFFRFGRVADVKRRLGETEKRIDIAALSLQRSFIRGVCEFEFA